MSFVPPRISRRKSRAISGVTPEEFPVNLRRTSEEFLEELSRILRETPMKFLEDLWQNFEGIFGGATNEFPDDIRRNCKEELRRNSMRNSTKILEDLRKNSWSNSEGFVGATAKFLAKNLKEFLKEFLKKL